ncbi:MAG: hypothetical protein ACK5HO_09835 [Pseudomonadota bacterium]
METRRVAEELLKLNFARRVVTDAEAHLRQVFTGISTSPEGYLTLTNLDSNEARPAKPNHTSIEYPYGLKGGAARECLAAIAHQRPERPPRDIDLVRRGSFAIASDEDIARQYMPCDFMHGARVELIRSMPRYLASRDLTVNELAVFQGSIFVSLLGALDTLGLTFRPSRYRGGSIHRQPLLEGKVFLKMARLFAEAECYNDPAELVGIPDQVTFSDFDLALHADKALQRSTSVARLFAETLVLLGALPASSDPLAALLDSHESFFGKKSP